MDIQRGSCLHIFDEINQLYIKMMINQVAVIVHNANKQDYVE